MIKKKIKVWGLTGGIASGKSTVARFLSENGFSIIDADQIAHQVRSESTTQQLLDDTFGTHDPKELRDKVFSDPDAKSTLESILHPLIRKRSLQAIKDMRTKSPPPKAIVYEASLIFQAGRQNDFDGVILVRADDSNRKDWLKRRDQLSHEKIANAFRSEDTTPDKEKLSTFVIDNHGDLDTLKSDVLALIPKLL